MKLLKMTEIKEVDIQNDILECLVMRRIGFFWRMNNIPVFDPTSKKYRAMPKFSQKGVCDIIGLISSRFIGIEVKSKSAFMWHTHFYETLKFDNKIFSHSPTSKREESALAQVQFIERIKLSGGLAFFTFSFEHVLATLKENSML